jgi:hypothetical protein
MTLNEYFNDSKFFLKKAGKLLSSEMTSDSAIEGVLYFALGMERVLKGLLYDINPIYILKNQEFKHSAPSLYKSKMLENIGQNSEISTKPDGDVLTFKLSLSRVKVFSKSAYKNSSLLFTLSNYRDVIVHRPLSELNIEKLSKLLQRELFPVVENFSKEIGLTEEDFFGENTEKVKKIGINIFEAEEFERKINIKIKQHADIWSQNKNDASYVELAEKTTNSLLHQKSNDYMFDLISCPACENNALVRIEPDYDIADGEGYLAGIYVDSLNCHFCGLNLESYEELDHFDINGILEQEP